MEDRKIYYVEKLYVSGNQSKKININHLNLYYPNDLPLKQNVQLLCVIPNIKLTSLNESASIFLYNFTLPVVILLLLVSFIFK